MSDLNLTTYERLCRPLMDEMKENIKDNKDAIDRNHAAITKLSGAIENGLTAKVAEISSRQWWFATFMILTAGSAITGMIMLILK